MERFESIHTDPGQENDDFVSMLDNPFLADTTAKRGPMVFEAGHFAWDEADGEYGRLVSEGIAEGFKDCTGSRTPAFSGRRSRRRRLISVATGFAMDVGA
jgi:hypothetical protein